MTFWEKYMSLHHDNRKAFIICQWQMNPEKLSVPYLIYRWIVTLYFILAMNYCIALDEERPYKWFISYSNLNMSICSISSFWCSMLFSKYQLSVRSDNIDSSVPERQLSSYKFYWYMNILAMNGPVSDEILRATLNPLGKRFNFKTEDVSDSIHYDYFNKAPVLVSSRMLSLPVVILDFLMVSHGVRFFHFIYVFMYGLLYVTFTGVYWACGGKDVHGNAYIYPVLQWGVDPIGALKASTFLLIFSAGVHVAFWMLHFVRKAFDKYLVRVLYARMEDHLSRHRLTNIIRRRYSSASMTVQNK